jgi:hypothetical protein
MTRRPKDPASLDPGLGAINVPERMRALRPEVDGVEADQAETMNDTTHPACLDDRRDPHPNRAARLKAAAPAPHEEMQKMMRQVHQDQNIRAAVVAHARAQLAERAASQRHAARMRKVQHHV